RERGREAGLDDAVADPDGFGQEPEADDDQLREDEEAERLGFAAGEAVRMQADAEHVDAEPGPRGHDVPEDDHVHEAALAHEAAPASVEHDRIPEDDDERAVFLRVPAPEAAPRL